MKKREPCCANGVCPVCPCCICICTKKLSPAAKRQLKKVLG